MIAGLVLTILAVALTNGQQEFIFHSNGTGGVACGNHHHCATNATCDQKHNMCHCPHWLEGNAKIHCLPPADPKLWIQNDPHIKNFHHEFASLLTPCRYKVFAIAFRTDTGVRAGMELFGNNRLFKAGMELFGNNRLFKGGEYYLTNLTFSMFVQSSDDDMTQIMEFTGDVSDDGKDYILVAKSQQMSIDSTPKGVEPSVSAESSLWGYTMDVEMDAHNNFLTVVIVELGVKLLFRPPSTSVHVNNKELPLVPGAVFTVDEDHWKYVQFGPSQYSVAAWPEGPSLEEMATEHNMSKPLYVQYLMLNHSMPFIPVEPRDAICEDISNNFHRICTKDETRVEMVNICSSIYAEKDFITCLSDKQSMDEYEEVQKDFFRQCQISLCQGNVTACEEMRKNMPELTKCPLPLKIQELDCSTVG
ncbi:hypothetical protein PoB_002384200 [Plakobranchus ocellatus]|uniref:VWFD domain-containing protein n=1 Tax=Plakobranchus ocellatus TaxID=259542 RepID=A0AAV3ZQ71_9GAST|nr:hypothetical protein PoB_002384200 [Plakobranchus ocellatus]